MAILVNEPQDTQAVPHIIGEEGLTAIPSLVPVVDVQETEDGTIVNAGQEVQPGHGSSPEETVDVPADIVAQAEEAVDELAEELQDTIAEAQGEESASGEVVDAPAELVAEAQEEVPAAEEEIIEVAPVAEAEEVVDAPADLIAQADETVIETAPVTEDMEINEGLTEPVFLGEGPQDSLIFAMPNFWKLHSGLVDQYLSQGTDDLGSELEVTGQDISLVVPGLASGDAQHIYPEHTNNVF